MANISHMTTFVLLGIVEMEKLKYLYVVFAIILYLLITLICFSIVYVTWIEESLHEPMYIIICNLVVDMMFGSLAFFPKLIIDLLTGCSTISLAGCLCQAFCIQIFSSAETCTFTLMAIDRYLAVAQPLRYHAIMTNGKAFNLLAGLWVFILTSIGTIVVLNGTLTICGTNIRNVYCETMSLLAMACGNTTFVNLFGLSWTLIYVISTFLTNVFCYISTYIVCLKISLEAGQKAIHTLITHVVTFGTCLSTGLFVIFRYRLNGGLISTTSHVAIAVSALVLTVTLNPLVYGMRTEALRNKIVQHLYRIKGLEDKAVAFK
ncbi:olfactory receptor 6E1-like [Gastrophryne carolinensis]